VDALIIKLQQPSVGFLIDPADLLQFLIIQDLPTAVLAADIHSQKYVPLSDLF
jgi:hypothetical protein